jgi:hypothetical protein
MSDDIPFDSKESRAIFDRISLSDDDRQKVLAAAGRRESIRSLASQVFFLRLCLNGRSLAIDDAERDGIRHYLDQIRLLIAATPAQSMEELGIKLAALDDREPLTAQNGNLRTMIEAGGRADVLRLAPQDAPRWMLDWSLT